MIALATSLRLTNMAHVLVVDDSVHVRVLVRVTLELDGHRIQEAVDGLEAWTLMKNERPDLVVMDVMMPGPSGLDVCRYMRADPDLASVPVLIITAGSEREKTATEAYRIGATAFMAKPFSPLALLAKVSEMLGA